MERCETCGCTLFHYYGFAVAADGRFLCEQCFAEEAGNAAPDPTPAADPVQVIEERPAGRVTCAACNGRRVTSQLVPEVKRSNGLDYHTGRQVERLFECDTCKGTGQTPEPEGPPPAGLITYYGAAIVAPHFTPDTFQAALSRARSRGTMPMIPAGPGAVLVESVRSGARYRVTRSECSCPGSQSHGVCMHRAAVIAAADLYGVDVCHTHLLGFDPAGHPVTAGARVAQLESVA